jgi:glycopeptide antibiotics resistance protein
MKQLATHPSLHRPERHISLGAITMFGSVPRALWGTVLAITLSSELIPRPNLTPISFYSYLSFKIVFFLLLGFSTPLTFWRFNSLNRGMLIAALSTIAVEILQLWIPGHSFSILELAGKLILMIFGIALALDARYDGRLRLGPVFIRLSDRHLCPIENPK